MNTSSQLASIRVILADDSSRFLSMLERAFASDPRFLVVGRAQSGQEALAQVVHLRPELVVLDLSMPGMNGLEVTRQIKTLAEAPHIIMLTLYDTPQYRAAAAAAGVDHFICKTELRTQLRPLLNSLLTSSSSSVL